VNVILFKLVYRIWQLKKCHACIMYGTGNNLNVEILDLKLFAEKGPNVLEHRFAYSMFSFYIKTERIKKDAC